MTKKLFHDPEHWRDRADDARRVATEILDPLSRRRVLDIAESYETLARRAAEREHEVGWAPSERSMAREKVLTRR
jgi:hypothetical protein